jgi:hypothetical protein
MKNQHDDVFIEYLTNRDNLPYTLDILRQGDEIRSRVLGDFWHAMLKQLRESTPRNLATKPLRWELYPSPKKMHATYAGLSCLHSAAGEQGQSLSFSVQQYCAPSEYQIQFGLQWDHEQSVKSKLLELPELVTLRSHLAENDFKHTRWWLGWKYIFPPNETRDGFLLKYAKDRNTILQQIEESFWLLVQETFEMTMKANRAIRKKA